MAEVTKVAHTTDAASSEMRYSATSQMRYADAEDVSDIDSLQNVKRIYQKQVHIMGR
jgi:hypothetical protein